MPRIITLQLEVTDDEAEAFINRFVSQANAVVEPASSAPAPSSSAPAPSSNADVDERGVPWHPDYHAATKNMTQAGAWKKRKGADAAAIEKYEAQYLGATPADDNPPPADMPSFLTGAMPTAAPAMPAAAPAMPAAQMPQSAPAPKPVSYDDMLAAFHNAIERMGEDVVMGAINDIYAQAGVADDVQKLGTDETARRIVKEKLDELA